jgi:hypothetical protein
MCVERGGLVRDQVTHQSRSALLVRPSKGHGILQGGRVLKFHVRLQWIAETSRKDVGLVLLRETSPPVHECEKLALKFNDCGVVLQLDQLPNVFSWKGMPNR